MRNSHHSTASLVFRLRPSGRADSFFFLPPHGRRRRRRGCEEASAIWWCFKEPGGARRAVIGRKFSLPVSARSRPDFLRKGALEALALKMFTLTLKYRCRQCRPALKSR